MANKKIGIFLIMDPPIEGRGNSVLRSNLITVFKTIKENNDNLELIIGNIECKFKSSILSRIINLLKIQINYIKQIIKFRDQYSVIFFTMGYIYFFPMLMARLMNKKTIYFISGLAGRKVNYAIMRMIFKGPYLGFAVSKIISIFEALNYSIANILLLESPNLINQLEIPTDNKKILLNGSLFVDISKFSLGLQTNILDREDIVGYFGIISEHKGVLNFIESIPLILEMKGSVRFLIGGFGREYKMVENKLSEIFPKEEVSKILVGPIPHSEMPNYLSQVKLVVLPSYGEGLPNIILESMASKTLVLATPVGGIPDVVKDGKTGFIAENNSPECIARNVVRSLNHPNLNDITNEARLLIEQNYSISAAVNRYESLIKVLD